MLPDEQNAHPLVHALRSRDIGIADQAARLIQQSARFLEYTLSTFSGGTDHTQRHTRTVEKIARMVLSDEFLGALSPQELFFLVLLCLWPCSPVSSLGTTFFLWQGRHGE